MIGTPKKMTAEKNENTRTECAQHDDRGERPAEREDGT